MKILHLITRLILGGAQQNTLLSCQAQVRRGHTVALAYGPIYGPEGSLLPEAERTGAELFEIPAMFREVMPLQDLRAYRQLRRLIRHWQPDLVHTHSSKAGILGRAAAWAERVPAIVHTVHGLPFHDHQSRAIHQAYVLAERWAARRSDHLVAITPAMAQAFEQKRIASAERFTVIPSGVDPARFTADPTGGQALRRHHGIPDQAPVVGLLARLDPLKGHRDLLAILPWLLERFPDLHYLFVGDGQERAAIQAHPATATGRVILTGLVPPAGIPAALSAMDVLTLPSAQEGQSRTLVEGLMCGVPIVGYDVGGIPAICIEGQTGRLTPPGDPQALAQAIAWTLNHREDALTLARQGREHVLAHFSVQTMTDQLETLYASLLPAPQGSTSP